MPILRTTSGLERVHVDNDQMLLKARTDLLDVTSDTLLKCTAAGQLEVTNTGAAAPGHDKVFTNGVDPSEAVAGGAPATKQYSIMGGCDAVTAAFSELNPIRVDGNGIQYVSNVTTTNIAPANTLNSHITDDPANSVAVGLTGRQTIGTATTQTHLKCSAAGELNTTNDKITQGEGIVAAGGNGLQQVLLYGKNGASGNLEPLETVTDRLVVKNLELGATGPTTVSSLSRIGVYGQVGTTGNYKTIRLTTDGRTETKVVNTDHDINQYVDQVLAGSATWTTTISTIGYNKLSIVVNGSAATPLMLSGSATELGTYLPFKRLDIINEDTGAGTNNIGHLELVSPPKFIKITNTDAGGQTLQIITTTST